MQEVIYVRLGWSGKRVQIAFCSSMTVGKIKELICDEEEIPPSEQRLSLAPGIFLDDDQQTLGYYGIAKNAELRMSLTVYGGINLTPTDTCSMSEKMMADLIQARIPRQVYQFQHIENNKKPIITQNGNVLNEPAFACANTDI